ncbi:MAG: pseudouridylate synthase [Gammaproteobacteria bacterium]|nr:pseudouridylate synthase [Gammaproteobacteria bacterium]
MTELSIIYQDPWYVAVHKPAGLLVHRTAISRDRQFLLQQLRDQIGQWVYPIHRLDRPTSGVILFGLSSDAARQMVACFTNREVEKRYLAVVRGYTDELGQIDYPLEEEPGKGYQSAVTDYQRLDTVELPHPVGRYTSARYSLLSLRPQTGRMHQIRRHMKHIFHPIVGDTTHGDGKHNQLFRDQFDCHRLLLQARQLKFTHPVSGESLVLQAAPDHNFDKILDALKWSLQ